MSLRPADGNVAVTLIPGSGVQRGRVIAVPLQGLGNQVPPKGSIVHFSGAHHKLECPEHPENKAGIYIVSISSMVAVEEPPMEK